MFIDKPYLRVEGDDGWIQAHWHSDGGLQAHDRNILRTKLRAQAADVALALEPVAITQPLLWLEQ